MAVLVVAAREIRREGGGGECNFLVELRHGSCTAVAMKGKSQNNKQGVFCIMTTGLTYSFIKLECIDEADICLLFSWCSQ